ncbi:hypothetical protein L914_16167 [Phytophthora nicotianae]|uniref:Uncharacterized protein n=1 Tax=Phytophthora nicotianae TaxID=4792 RepID=W2MLT2_PHYNI|nr:hypothetical protein L914_16167 [Phytophthora nicotianae]
MRFATFIEEYDVVDSINENKPDELDTWERCDREGYIKRRSKPVVDQKSPWGLTCPYIMFHSNAIPNVAFAYVALSRIQHRYSIVITHKPRLEKLTLAPDRIAEFQREETRVSDAVGRTATGVALAIQRMKLVALAHNAAMGPR